MTPELTARVLKVLPSFHSLPPEKQVEVAAAVKAIADFTDANPGAPMPAEMALKLGQLVSPAGN